MLSTAPDSTRTRRDRRDATRATLLQAAVETLVDRGVAGTTTLAVQARAGVSRGALLHHFPSHADLLAATVAELVRRNESGIRAASIGLDDEPSPLARAIRTLERVSREPSHLAEMELWSVARTDARLRAALRVAERPSLRENRRVLDELFEPLAHEPGCAIVIELTVQFLRGLALTGMLQDTSAHRERLLAEWIAAATLLIARSPVAA